MARKKLNPAVITMADYECYLVYELRRGYGHHKYKDMVRTAKEDLRIGKSRTVKMHRTEYYKITEGCGLSSVKYVGTMSLKNFIDHIDNMGYDTVENTMGILSEHGWMDVISFSCFSVDLYTKMYSEDELRQIFRKDYETLIFQNQGVDDRSVYVNISVPNYRIDKAVRSIIGKNYSEMDEAERDKFSGQLNAIGRACCSLYDFLKRRMDDCCAEMPDERGFVVDFRQTCINFK